MTNELQLHTLLEPLRQLCEEAGEAILEVYRKDIEVETKADNSPVTQADLAAHNIIIARLAQLTPDIPIISEEGEIPSFKERQQWARYWLIDPLDGTKEFINRNDEFTVNIALIQDNKAVLGLVYAPVLGICYTGDQLSPEPKAFKWQNNTPQQIHCQAIDQQQVLKVVGSRRHGAEALDQLLSRLGETFAGTELDSMGSSLKLCLIAEGRADLYPRLAPTCEWDTAAAQAVVEAAGGQVLNPQFETLSYGHKDELLNPFFYVVGDPSIDWANLL